MVLKLRIVGAGPGAPAGEPGPTADRVVELDDAIAEIRFGLRAGLEVELPFPALAPEHARMLRDGTGWVVEDLGSDAGTSVDGRPLERGGRAAIAPGQTLRLAHVAVRFEGAGAPARVGESTATLARRLVSDLFRATRQAQVPELVVLAGAFPGAASGACALRLVEPDRPYVVGRAETCDLVLPTDDVSREHAVIVRRWQGVHVRDLGSKNGVTMAGEPIGGERRLRDGDVIEVGSVRFRLDDPEDRYLRQLDAPSAPEPPVAVATPAPRPRARIGPLATAVSALVLLAIAAIALLLAL